MKIFTAIYVFLFPAQSEPVQRDVVQPTPVQPISPTQYLQAALSKKYKKNNHAGCEQVDNLLRANAGSKWIPDALIEEYLAKITQAHQNSHDIIKILPGSFFEAAAFDSLLHNRPHMLAKFAKADKILWPILQGNHWYLAVINKQKDTVFIDCVDGFNGHQKHAEIIKKAEQLVQALYPEIDMVCAASNTIEAQENTDDCGAVVSLAAKTFLVAANNKQWSNTLRVQDYNPFRLEMAAVLVDESNLATYPNTASKVVRGGQ